MYDLAPGPVAELAAKDAKAAGSPREVGERADVICPCVPEDRHVREAMSGRERVLARARAGAVIAIHSTILPETAVALAAEATPLGVAVLDACVRRAAAPACRACCAAT